jgi:hypothetical protein
MAQSESAAGGGRVEPFRAIPMRCATSRVSFLMCPFSVRERCQIGQRPGIGRFTSRQKTDTGDQLRPASELREIVVDLANTTFVDLLTLGV